mmetsp:Transcript_11526/g.31092  ORF Transcript_11526/g.31092 Transcript_11526/m.31092 type:complete len:182 (+) Transcript_11526:116-661(+)
MGKSCCLASKTVFSRVGSARNKMTSRFSTQSHWHHAQSALRQCQIPNTLQTCALEAFRSALAELTSAAERKVAAFGCASVRIQPASSWTAMRTSKGPFRASNFIPRANCLSLPRAKSRYGPFRFCTETRWTTFDDSRPIQKSARQFQRGTLTNAIQRTMHRFGDGAKRSLLMLKMPFLCNW